MAHRAWVQDKVKNWTHVSLYRGGPTLLWNRASPSPSVFLLLTPKYFDESSSPLP